MPTFGATISGFVREDDLDVIRTINGIPSGQSVTDGYMTVKAAGGSTIFQKHITGTAVPGQGQITDDGSGDQIAAVRFELVGGPGQDTTQLTAGTPFNYDIQVNTSGGKRYTPETGTITTNEQYTVGV